MSRAASPQRREASEDKKNECSSQNDEPLPTIFFVLKLPPKITRLAKITRMIS